MNSIYLKGTAVLLVIALLGWHLASDKAMQSELATMRIALQAEQDTSQALRESIISLTEDAQKRAQLASQSEQKRADIQIRLDSALRKLKAPKTCEEQIQWLYDTSSSPL